MNPPVPVQPTTRWGADPIRMKVGPITRAQAKRFKDNLAAFIQRLIHSQEGLTIPEDTRSVLSIQVMKVDTDPGSDFGAIMDRGQHEMVPKLHGFNTYA